MPSPRSVTPEPLGVFLVMSDAATLLRRNASALMLGLLPCLVLAVVLPHGAMHLALALAPHGADGSVAPDAVPFWLVFAGLLAAFAVAWSLATATTARICLDDLAGRKTDATGALGHSLRRLPAFICLTLVSATGIAAGALLFVWPAFYLAAIWSMALAVLVAEDTGVWTALRRSAALAAGNRWRVFALLLICGGLAMLAGLAADATAGPEGYLAIAVALATSALWTVVTVALYGRRVGLTVPPLRSVTPIDAPAARA